MPLQLYIEGPNATAAAEQLQRQFPGAQRVQDDNSDVFRGGPESIATLIAIFGAVTAGAGMVKAIADAGLSVAKFAKLLLDWKKEAARDETTVLKKTTPEGEEERLVLKADTKAEKVEEFLEKE